MRKPAGETIVAEGDELREHYDFDYSKAKPNRFAERIRQDSLMVVLDPDVAAIFPTTESVNSTLRAIAVVLENLPKAGPAQRRKRSSSKNVSATPGGLAG